jgi:hypothetical protein
LNFQEWTLAHQDSQQNVPDKMDQVNQAAAYGFLLGGFAISSLAPQFNTLHSCSCTLVTEFLLPFITAAM